MQITTGDIYRLGNHLIACGDATDQSLIEKILGSENVQLLLTDPPYGVGYVESKQGLLQANKHAVIQNDQTQTEAEYAVFTKNWLQPILPHLVSPNCYYIFNSDKMIFALKNALDELELKLAQLLIWVKSQPVVGRLDYLPQHELIAYGWHGTHKFNRSKDKSVLFYPKPNKSVLHPTMKPIGLLRKLILNSSKINGVVFDPFLGSGSTLIACEQTKRRCFGIELDPLYCQVIIDRYTKLTGVEAVKL